jgi:hypothetical protein
VRTSDGYVDVVLACKVKIGGAFFSVLAGLRLRASTTSSSRIYRFSHIVACSLYIVSQVHSLVCFDRLFFICVVMKHRYKEQLQQSVYFFS